MGKVITFYSYKGGTGRSMTLANVAWLLAANGARVLVIDWDLEAPGLHRYFKPFLVDPDLFETEGLIDAFWDLAAHALTDISLKGKSPLEALDFGGDGIDLEYYISPLTWRFRTGGIDFIGAGQQSATFAERVNTFDWKRFYQLGGGKLLEKLRGWLISEYNFVLIDSRTGVSDTSGICTMQMPDVLVACFTLNYQSIEGVTAILQSVRESQNGGGPETGRAENRREIAFYPVAMRIENSEKDKLGLARDRARTALGPFLPSSDQSNPRMYWDDMEVSYWPFYAYEEILATFGDPAGASGSAKTLLSEMEAVARRVTGRSDVAMAQIPEADRQAVLAQYAFGIATPNLSGHQFLLVEFPGQRSVLANGSEIGFTNQTLQLPANIYVISLDGDETTPASQQVSLAGPSSLTHPTVIRFRPPWLMRTFSGHGRGVRSVALIPGGRALSGSEDETIRLWDLETGNELRRLEGRLGIVLSVAALPDGQRVLSGSFDRRMRLWDLETGAELRRFEGHSDWVETVAVLPDGRQILSGSGDCTMRLWDLQSGAELRRFEGHAGTVASVVALPHGERALSGSHDGTVRLWDLAAGEELRRLEGHQAGVNFVAVTPGGGRALSGSADQTVRLWDLRTGAELRRFVGHASPITSVVVLPDGRRALSGSEDGNLRLWHLEIGAELLRRKVETGGIGSLALLPDGRQALVGLSDGTLRLCDIGEG